MGFSRLRQSLALLPIISILSACASIESQAPFSTPYVVAWDPGGNRSLPTRVPVVFTLPPSPTPTITLTPTATVPASTPTETPAPVLAVTPTPIASGPTIQDVAINMISGQGLNIWWYLQAASGGRYRWRLRFWRVSNGELLAEQLYKGAGPGGNSYTESWFAAHPQEAGTEIVWNIEVCDGCGPLVGGWTGDKVVAWREGRYWIGSPASDIKRYTPTATSLPTLTPTYDPFVQNGRLVIDKVVFQYATRDATRPNGAIAYMQIDFMGGQAPFQVLNDGIVVLSGGTPTLMGRSSTLGGNLVWLLFPVQSACGAQMAATVKLISADGQTSDFQYFVSEVACR